MPMNLGILGAMAPFIFLVDVIGLVCFTAVGIGPLEPWNVELVKPQWSCDIMPKYQKSVKKKHYDRYTGTPQLITSSYCIQSFLCHFLVI